MIKHQMEQQLKVLEELSDLVNKAETAGNVDNVTKEDTQHLRGYIKDMQRACKTAIAIEEALKPSTTEAVKPSETPKRKTRTKKPVAQKEVAPEPQKAQTEDADLSFLD